MDSERTPLQKELSPSLLSAIEIAKKGPEKSFGLEKPDSENADPCLFATFQELEKKSRDSPNNATKLATAIQAGENVVAQVSPSEKVDTLKDALPILIDLYFRRSRLDSALWRQHLERAIELAQQWHCLEGETVSGLNAVHKLAMLYEERYERSANTSDLEKSIQYFEDAASLSQTPQSLLTDAACLRFKQDSEALPCILEIPIHELPTRSVAFTHVAQRKFRFIDARSLASRDMLRVLEFDILPKQRYVALSYVWRGSHTPNSEEHCTGTMTIEGATGADPISINVLATVCRCVMKFNCDLLWIDGACIIQNDEYDKSWQIQNMLDIYKFCNKCIVLPGGLSRLVPLTERTSWIHRAWTLQEAIAPDSAVVLFSWTLGDCVLRTHFYVPILEVEVGKAAQANLHSLLMISPGPADVLTAPSFAPEAPAASLVIRLLGDETEQAQMMALLGAIDHRGEEGMRNAVWRSALMRVASRPADTIFSIMGLMGVVLDPLMFDSFDRVKPTIALMRAVLQKGEPAEWLGAAPQMAINPLIPTFPKFPQVGDSGRPTVRMAEDDVPISQAMGDTCWRLVGAPKGDMRKDGTLSIYAPKISIRLKRTDPADVLLTSASDSAIEGTAWYACPNERGPPFAIQVGEKQRYTNGAFAPMVDLQPFLVMLVGETSCGLVRNVGYATMSKDTAHMAGWIIEEIAIMGGHA